MFWKQETVLIGQDEKGNPVAMWRKHPTLKMDLMYLNKQVKMTDVEKFGDDVYSNNFSEKLRLKINQHETTKTSEDSDVQHPESIPGA